MNNSAQSFEPFRLLIAVVMALAILVIIISAINYFSGFQINVSEGRLLEGFQQAYEKIVDEDSEEFLVKEDLFLNATVYSTVQFTYGLDINPNCIEFKSIDIPVYEITNNGHTIELIDKVSTNVYFKCVQTYSNDCPIECTIAFGDKID